MSDEGKTERSLVGRLTAMLEAERAAHEETKRELVSEILRLLDCAEKAERERDEWKKVAEANMAPAESNAETAGKTADERDEARARVAQLEEAIRAADGSHLHAADCSSAEPFYEPPAPACDCNRNEAKAALVEAALSTSPSDWLAEHDRSIAERQREACAVALRQCAPEYTGDVRSTPLVTK